MSAQSDRQAAVRAYTGTALTYEGDWLALFDQLGISPDGGFNGRLLAWINYALGANYTEINGAMAAYAVTAGATNWSSMGTVPQGAPIPANFAFIRTVPGTQMLNPNFTYAVAPALSGQGVSP